jgi:hypothetical protein
MPARWAKSTHERHRTPWDRTIQAQLARTPFAVVEGVDAEVAEQAMLRRLPAQLLRSG